MCLQAGKSDQLEQVVYQMRSDLQQATQLLEHTGGAVHEQAALNQQLQEQMQQVGSTTNELRLIKQVLLQQYSNLTDAPSSCCAC